MTMANYPIMDNSFVKLRILDGGSFIASRSKITEGSDDSKFRLYDLAFLIQDPTGKRNILWDVGLSNDISKYTPFVRDVLWPETMIVGPRVSLAEQLYSHYGVEPAAVDTIIFSHAHYDHCRPISDEFPSAKSWFGPGTAQACAPGHLKDASSQWDGRFFDPEGRTEEWEELKGPWVPFGPFNLAMDYLGDGSFWIVQAPGHMPGNLIAILRIESGDWIVLGGDCCHSYQIYLGTEDFARFSLPNGTKACLQMDIPAAKDSLSRISQLQEQLEARIVFAHDIGWALEGERKDDVLLSFLSPVLRGSVKYRLPRGDVL